MARSATLAALLLAAVAASAQTPGACALGTAQGDLDASDVFARVFNTGALFFGNTTTNGDGYIVPKYDGASPIFAAGLWVGGTVGGETRVAGARYSGFTFWPGPLNEGGSLPDPADCSGYDRIYVVSVADVAAYEGGAAPAADLRDWPVGLGAPAVDAGGRPVVPAARDQVLDLAAGERPALSGTQTAFWVLNDVGGPHTEQGTAPLGLEVRVTAFAVASEVDALDQATFYRYELLNRSGSPIDDAYAGFFVDADLGDPSDDYVGTDTTRSMLFFYNGAEVDRAYGVPPAVGLDVLGGAAASGHFESSWASPTADPTAGEAVYNFLRGYWGDGTPKREGGNGYGAQNGAPVTPWIFPGDPVTEAFWSEVNNDGAGTDNGTGDRRAVVSAGPFTLAPGAAHTVDLAVVFAQGADRLDSVTRLRVASDLVQAAYDDGSLARLGGDVRVLPAPALLAPDDGADLRREEVVTFTWAPIDGAEGYHFEWGVAPDALSEQQVTRGTSVDIVIPDSDGGAAAGLLPLYWRVTAGGSGSVGVPSPVRSVVVFRGGVLTLADGAPAYVEVAGPGGADPCATGAVSTEGCDEVFGNLVYRSLNSTGEYYLSERGLGSEATLPLFAPNDFEIRFTEAGGLGYFAFSDGQVVRVPFEVWDVGVVAPGEPNDPADDVRLIPVLLASGGGSCAFDPAGIPEAEATFGSGYVESDRLYAYYPTTSYADFEAAYLPLVEGAADGCYVDADFTGLDFLDVDRGRPIQRQVFGSSAAAPALPRAGTVIRLYTVDRPVAAGRGPEAVLSVSVSPNPVRTAASVSYAVAVPGRVRLAVYDVLGREVAVLADGEAAAGDHRAHLEVGALASGVYVVVVEAGGGRAARTVTVVR